MNDDTQTALAKSIAHWRRLLDIAHIPLGRVRYKTLQTEGAGVHSCALCNKFLDLTSATCDAQCPVKQKTGRSGCDGTPYQEAAHALREDAPAQAIPAVKAELEFLQSLQRTQPHCSKCGSTNVEVCLPAWFVFDGKNDLEFVEPDSEAGFLSILCNKCTTTVSLVFPDGETAVGLWDK